MTQPTKPLTAKEIYAKHHQHESKFGWSNMIGGYIEKTTRDDKEKCLDAMEEYASQYKEEVDRLKEEIKLLKE